MSYLQERDINVELHVHTLVVGHCAHESLANPEVVSQTHLCAFDHTSSSPAIILLSAGNGDCALKRHCCCVDKVHMAIKAEVTQKNRLIRA